MTEKKISGFFMRASQIDKANISKLARRWRVSEADAVRLAVLQSLQSDRVPHIPLSMRRLIVIRRKVAA